MSGNKVCVIIPSINEEPTIGKVIDEIPRQALEQAGYAVEVLVVDNLSTDKTREIAEQKGATVIVEPRKGKGNTIRTALRLAKSDLFLILDADYTYPATYVPDMLRLLSNHDVVIGSRLKGQCEKGAMSRLNLIGNHLLSLMATFLYQRRISDICTGYWGFRAEAVKRVSLEASGFGIEAELFSQFARKGCSIAELPIHYRRRVSPSKLKSLRDGIKIGWTLMIGRFQG